MTQSIWFYLKNVFVNPIAAAKGISNEKKLWKLILFSSLLGILPYWLILLLGYQALGWYAFPYQEYYPYYFDPYWWELLVIPVWGLVIAVGFSTPCYLIGKRLGGQATFTQVIAVVMLGTVVSLPIFVIVDLFSGIVIKLSRLPKQAWPHFLMFLGKIGWSGLFGNLTPILPWVGRES